MGRDRVVGQTDPMSPPEESPTRTLQVALSAMALVALTVGLIVGGLVLALHDYTGVDEVAEARARQAPETMSVPPYQRTPPDEEEPGVTTYDPSPTPTVDLPSGSPVAGTTQPGIILAASPRSVSPGQQLNLSGRYGREGASLQVQRQQAGGVWTDFPVTTTVTGGTFETYIVTSQTGTAQLRMIDKATGRTSNLVTVTVG